MSGRDVGRVVRGRGGLVGESIGVRIGALALNGMLSGKDLISTCGVTYD